MYQESKRIEFLDSVRGLAALFVLLSHVTGAFAWPAAYEAMVNWPFTSILFNGKEAVAMFFVLSGYVLAKPYVETDLPRRDLFLPTFYLRRFIRIWPPWFFAFVLSIVARKFLYHSAVTNPPISQWLAQFWQVPLTVADFFRQCLFLLHDPARQLLNQDWSLGVELKGSVLVPLFIVFARRKYVPLVVPLAAVMLLLIWTGEYYVSFLFGVLTAQYGAGWSERISRWGTTVKITVLMAGLMLYQGLDFGLWLFNLSYTGFKYGWVMTAVGCAVILVTILSSRRLQRGLNWKPFVFLGKISYSVYLSQFVIILCLLPPLVALVNRMGEMPLLALFLGTIVAGVAATIGCATVMYFLVEVPVINFGHWLTKKIQKRYLARERV